MKINFRYLLFISLAINVLILFWVPFHLNSVKSNLEEDGQKYPYLSKRIFAENANDILINFVGLRTSIRDYINKADVPISFYFEYLPSGVSVGVNDRDDFKLASLVKVPIAMAIYKEIEEGEITEEEKLTLKKEHIDQQFGELWKKGEGAKISVKEALQAMLTRSDNTAVGLLLDNVKDGVLDEVFDGLDIPKPVDGQYPTLTTKNYSSLLRSLYLSSYLEKENSNDILTYLIDSVEKDKLVAGVPLEVKVAHKIGFFQSLDNAELINSDCGIIYLEKRPYLLCVMVRGNNEKAVAHISSISKFVYDYVNRVNR